MCVDAKQTLKGNSVNRNCWRILEDSDEIMQNSSTSAWCGLIPKPWDE